MQRPARVVDMSAKLEALSRRHAEYDERLRAFEGRIYLTPDEEAEIRMLKREKLRAKDEMRRVGEGPRA